MQNVFPVVLLRACGKFSVDLSTRPNGVILTRHLFFFCFSPGTDCAAPQEVRLDQRPDRRDLRTTGRSRAMDPTRLVLLGPRCPLRPPSSTEYRRTFTSPAAKDRASQCFRAGRTALALLPIRRLPASRAARATNRLPFALGLLISTLGQLYEAPGVLLASTLDLLAATLGRRERGRFCRRPG